MNSERERNIKLAPLDVDLETNLAVVAMKFFNPSNYEESCKAIEKSPDKNTVLPMSGSDFIIYLDKIEILNEPATKYIYHVRNLLGKMVTSNILVLTSSIGWNPIIPGNYYALSGISQCQRMGCLWLAKSLGGRFIHRQVSPAIVHITGENEKGDAVSGSGIIFDSLHILTCRHVVSDMKVDSKQKFQGKEINVDCKSIYKHEKNDIAVMRVNRPLRSVPGLAFLSPVVAQTVYTFGYPRIPNVRPNTANSDRSYLVMQSGEVTNESVIASDNSKLFLYSAITRPGNSGGAIISEDGYVVGISTILTDGRYADVDVFAPHYAGIPAHVVANSVAELNLDIEIPFEMFN